MHTLIPENTDSVVHIRPIFSFNMSSREKQVSSPQTVRERYTVQYFDLSCLIYKLGKGIIIFSGSRRETPPFRVLESNDGRT